MYGQTQIGTPLYMCPEMYKRERYDTKVDSWSRMYFVRIDDTKASVYGQQYF